jgi:hypothetical protein
MPAKKNFSVASSPSSMIELPPKVPDFDFSIKKCYNNYRKRDEKFDF